MPRVYAYIPLMVAASSYASAGYSVAMLSHCILLWLAGSLATLIGGETGLLYWVGAEAGWQGGMGSRSLDGVGAGLEYDCYVWLVPPH